MSDLFKGKWLTRIHYWQGNCEVSVVREDNEHGRRSLGWDSADKKILLATNKFDDRLWKKLKPHIEQFAQETANRFNRDTVLNVAQ